MYKRQIHGQSPVQADLDILREVGFILEFFIHDLLNLWVLGGINPETAAIDSVAGLNGSVALLLHQILLDLADQLIYKIRIGSSSR